MNVYNTLVLLGILQGIIIGFYWLIKNKDVTFESMLLSLFIINLSLSLYESWIVSEGVISMTTNYKFGIPFHLLTLTTFYLYIKHYIHAKPIKRIHYFILVSPFVASIGWKILYQFFILLNISFFSFELLKDYLTITHNIFLIISIVYLIELIFNLIQYQKKSSNASKEVKKKITWIFYFFSILFGVLILWCFLAVIFTKMHYLRYLAFIVTTFIIYWLSFTKMYELRKNTRTEEVTQKVNSNKKTNTSKIKVKKEKAEKILEGLKKLEAQKYYLRSDCTIISIAKKLKTNNTYVAKVIKLHYQKNFNQYLNDLRIEYVINRLSNDTKLRKYSIASISKEVGYKTPDTFTKHFRQHTGVLPSSYIKQLNRS
ncbi:helix-turn-helix domain-containing protein [Kordia sp.]|uniref:helix-turn-helix domain-containing protein n=1 Tax=Kordia sp. TaxID=1965332 RepID=UPI003B592833